MHRKKRYRELLFIVDTCQAESLFLPAYSPGIAAVGSSRVGEDSLSHHTDPNVGVYVIDRFTYYLLEFLERVQPSSGGKRSGPTLQDLFNTCPPNLCVSHVTARVDLYPRDPRKVPVLEFFGASHSVVLTQDVKKGLLTKQVEHVGNESTSTVSNKHEKHHSSVTYARQAAFLPADAFIPTATSSYVFV